CGAESQFASRHLSGLATGDRGAGPHSALGDCFSANELWTGRGESQACRLEYLLDVGVQQGKTAGLGDNLPRHQSRGVVQLVQR
ncbi:MAG: hypothetical protein WBN68_00855, partial [Sedimenticolaceae bacterium]